MSAFEHFVWFVPTAPYRCCNFIVWKMPSDFFAGSYVQATRVAGTDLTTDFVDQREFFGAVPDQLRQLDEYIQINVRQPLEVNNSTHSKGIDYPIDALRQLIRNALIHRMYEARIRQFGFHGIRTESKFYHQAAHMGRLHRKILASLVLPTTVIRR